MPLGRCWWAEVDRWGSSWAPPLPRGNHAGMKCGLLVDIFSKTGVFTLAKSGRLAESELFSLAESELFSLAFTVSGVAQVADMCVPKLYTGAGAPCEEPRAH